MIRFCLWLLAIVILIPAAQADEGYERIQHCMAVNIYWEAASSNEPVSSQMLVAFVTLNRSLQWHQDVCDVVFAPKQFSWTDGALNKRGVLRAVYHPPNNKAWAQAQQIAAMVLHGASDFTHGALYYHADYIIPPPAFLTRKYVGQFGKHMAYR
jgi:N-acetylmuramoyl-L-alanine amidase